ncbi:MAG: hypothetical protein ABI603_12210 [Acidobacteriota bacterium]
MLIRASTDAASRGATARSHPGRGAVFALLALMLVLGAARGRAQAPSPRLDDAPSAGGRYDPRLRFRTISTARFDIHFHQGEERLAARLAGIVEEVAGEVDRHLGAPRGRVQVVLVDQSDQSNGWATVFPYNLIELAAVPPASRSTIGNTSDWLRLVFIHEYTHIVHLEKSRGWLGGLTHVFGRVPLLYPNLFLPGWQVEGIATFEESRVTGEGRVPAGDFRMVLEEAAAARRLLPLDRAGGGLVDWPSGNAPYVYGAYFHDYLARRYGEASLSRLAEETAGSLPYLGARAFRQVFGRPLGALWNDFESEHRLAASTAERLEATRLTTHGFAVAAPAFAKDGRLFYSVANPHGFPALMELAPGRTAPRRLGSRYHGERIAIAGGEIVFDQLEVVHEVGLQSDLYAMPMVGGAARRLTREARAAEPDVAPDGRTMVCTVQEPGRRILATLQMPERGRTAVPVPLVAEASTEFSSPRFSADGRTIAAERRRLGGPSEIVVVDASTGTVRTLVGGGRDRKAGPVWLPDGSSILFASDRDGPFGIYQVEVATGATRRLLGAARGAQSPALSPDGRLVFVGYTADGYDLFALPLAAARWSAPAASDPDSAPAPLPDRVEALPGRAYRPWSTLPPRYWVPVIETRQGQVLAGAATGGGDALGRHAYAASGSWITPRHRPDWRLDYAYARWWPTLFGSASGTTEDWRDGDVRSRELSGGVLLPVRRVRWSSVALAGIHTERDHFACSACAPALDAIGTRRDLRLGWLASNAHAFGYSISAEEGGTVGVTSEITRGRAGTGRRAGAGTVDARHYWRVFPRHAVVAARVAAAATWGDRDLARVFEASGAGPQSAGFDFGSGSIALLRGFRAADVFGRHAAVVNLEYRFPIAWPQRGAGTLPLMLRSLHGALFVDAGHAWDTAFRSGAIRRSFGAELSAATVLGYSLPLTMTAGAAWRDDPSGRRRGWAAFGRLGRAF